MNKEDIIKGVVKNISEVDFELSSTYGRYETELLKLHAAMGTAKMEYEEKAIELNKEIANLTRKRAELFLEHMALISRKQ